MATLHFSLRSIDQSSVMPALMGGMQAGWRADGQDALQS
jgi:hypothetical protein